MVSNEKRGEEIERNGKPNNPFEISVAEPFLWVPAVSCSMEKPHPSHGIPSSLYLSLKTMVERERERIK